MSDQPLSIKKIGYSFPISSEALMLYIDPFKKRTVKSKTWVKPSKAEKKAYKKWLARYDEITAEGRKAGWYFEGYDGPEFNAPEAHYEYEYEEDE